jgi:hypothetical protein
MSSWLRHNLSIDPSLRAVCGATLDGKTFIGCMAPVGNLGVFSPLCRGYLWAGGVLTPTEPEGGMWAIVGAAIYQGAIWVLGWPYGGPNGSSRLTLYSLDVDTLVWTERALLAAPANWGSWIDPCRMEGRADGLYMQARAGSYIWRGYVAEGGPAVSDWFSHGVWFWSGAANWHGKGWTATTDVDGSTITSEVGGAAVAIPYPPSLVTLLGGSSESSLVGFFVAEGVGATIWVRSIWTPGALAEAYAAAGLFTRTTFAGMGAATDLVDYLPTRIWASERKFFMLGWTPEGTVLEVLGEGLRLYSFGFDFSDGSSGGGGGGGNLPRLKSFGFGWGRTRVWDGRPRLLSFGFDFSDGSSGGGGGGGNLPRLSSFGFSFSDGTGAGKPRLSSFGFSWAVQDEQRTDYRGPRLKSFGFDYALTVTVIPSGGELYSLLLPVTFDAPVYAVRVTPRCSLADAARCRAVVRADSETLDPELWSSYESFAPLETHYLRRVGNVIRVGLVVPADLGYAPLFGISYCW